MSDAYANQLAPAAATGQYSRRDLLRRVATIGLAAPTISGILAACGGGGAPPPAAAPPAGAAPTSAAAAPGPKAPLPTGEARNPLKVPEDQPLDSVIFKGGYSDEYAINAEGIYQQAYPKAKVSHQGIQRLQEQLQPRFVGGTPPDVIDNSGAGNLDTAALVAEGQLADLADLMEAPAFDSSGKKFKDTLLPGSQDNAVYDGKQFALLYAYTVNGIWSSTRLLKDRGWEYPKTWDGMLKLCEEIKKAGIAPWTYTGKFPQYLYMVLMPMIYKAGGIEAIKRLDNLEPNAWQQPEVKASAEALYQLADRGYIMPGSEGLTHTESQAEWLQGKAVFIPVGSWLENEMKGQVPDGFNMAVKPVPSLSVSDKVPFEGIQASAGETFIVPSKGKNVQGGKELLRILFSMQGARFFSENTRALTVVQGSANGLDLGTAFASVQAAADAAGSNRFTYLFGTWYAKMRDDIKDQLGAMMTKKITPAEFVNKAQEFADSTAKDNSIKKYKRA